MWRETFTFDGGLGVDSATFFRHGEADESARFYTGNG